MAKGRQTRTCTCARCGEEAEHDCRGLCQGCAGFLRRLGDGKLDELYPRTLGRTEDWQDDWEVLRERGMSKRQASVYMGYKEKTLERMILRERGRDRRRRRDEASVAA